MVSTPSPAAFGLTATGHDHDVVPVQAPEAPSGDADHVTAPAPVAVPVSVLAPVQVTVRAKGWAAMANGGAPLGGRMAASRMSPPGRMAVAARIKAIVMLIFRYTPCRPKRERVTSQQPRHTSQFAHQSKIQWAKQWNPPAK
jgi:hypothetical protein